MNLLSSQDLERLQLELTARGFCIGAWLGSGSSGVVYELFGYSFPAAIKLTNVKSEIDAYRLVDNRCANIVRCYEIIDLKSVIETYRYALVLERLSELDEDETALINNNRLIDEFNVLGSMVSEFASLRELQLKSRSRRIKSIDINQKIYRDIFKALKLLGSLGIDWGDCFSGNVLKDANTGVYKIIDLGYANIAKK